MACISGYTNGVYSYVDCCGLTRVGVSSGETVCLDQSYSGSAVNIVYDTGSTCTQACSGTSELSYFFTVTGTCGIANGAVTITPNGGYPPYTIDPIFPVGHGLSAQTGTTSITFTGLTDETYVFRLNDSLGDVNSELFINVSVGNCFSATTTSVEGTTCGLENGFISVSGSSTTPPYNILLYKDEVLNQIQQTTSVPYNFPELSEGIYYALLVDSSNVTAKTENVVISASTQLDFGLWKVDTSQCATDKGKISVTGQTGECPYTYLWSDGQTGQTITGLTVGEYSVTVTDNQGCELTKSIFVDIASPLGVGLVTGTNPTCFSSNGVIDITITGGSVPYYYSASSGNIGVTLSNQLSITGLSAGDYQIIIKDANLCTLDVITELNSVNGFRNVSNVITNSTCSFDNGLVQTTIVGSYGFYSYTLSGQNTNQIFTKFTQDQNVTFDGLQTDTYLLTISGESSSCVYTESLEVTSESKFTVTATTTPSSCGSQNGSISVNVSTGYTEPIDYVLSNGNTLQNVNFSSYTFNFLTPGNYTLQVTDADSCTVSLDLTVPLSGNLISTLTKTDCTNNNDGAATVTIFDGAPPFTFDWSENVPSGSTGSTVTGLSGGSYSVTVTDNSGCTEFWTFDIVCNQFLVTGRTRYNVVNQKFDTLTGTKRSIQKMINEGFFDLINLSGYSNCILNKVELEALVTINGSTSGQTFTYADDYSWQHAIEDILDTIPEVNSYSISALNNTLEITCDCSSISSNYFKIELEITYDIKCSQLATPTPTPTPSPTPTPTYVPTATPTATPTPTPTSSGIVWFTNLDIYNIADEDVCEDTICNRSLYTTGSTINIGDIIYTDPLLTTNYVGTNFGPTDGFARIYVSSACPITTRNVLQVNDLGVVLSKYTC